MTTPLDDLLNRYPVLATAREEIEDAFVLLRDAYRRGNKVLLCGNGGSAADAEHWAAELLKGFDHPRPLSVTSRAALGTAALADRLQGALPAIPLTGFPSLATAFGNDVDPEYVFAQLAWALGREGDVLVGLSTSGNANNVNHAFHVARARKMPTLALTGADGGTLARLATVLIRVAAATTPEAQELHLPVYHCLSRMLEEEFFGAAPSS